MSSVGGIGPVPLAMLALALVTSVLGGVSLRASRRELERQATTDALTGLGNRRKLMGDLARNTKTASADDAAVRQEQYFVHTADGIVWASYTDARGELNSEHIPPGETIVWPASRESEY